MRLFQNNLMNPKSKIKLWMLYLIFISWGCVYSQKNEYESAWINADNNVLPQNSIKSIVKDKNGFIWLATESGIVRYDGKNYLVFDTKNIKGLTSNRMFFFQGSISKDSIYISNEYLQYVLINKGRPHLVKNKKLPNYVGTQVFKSKPSFEKIYFNKGYYEIKKDYIISNSFKNKKNWKISLDTLDYDYFVFGEELYGYDKHRNFVCFSDGIIKKVTIEGLQNSKSKILINQNTQQVFFSDNETLEMLVFKNGKLSLDSILNDFNISESNIFSIYFDPTTKILYVGSYTKGLLIIKQKNFKTLYGHNFNYDVYYSQIAFGENKFLSSFGELFTPSGVSRKIKFKSNHDGYKLMLDKNENLWTKSYDTLYCFLKNTDYKISKKWIFNNYNISFLENKKSKIIVGLSHDIKKEGKLLELSTIDDGKFSEIMSLEFRPQFLINKDSEVIWAGSNSGLYKIDILKKACQKIKTLPNIEIRSLKIEGNDKIWFTTYSHGFFLYDNATQKITQFPLDKDKYLSSSHCIIEDRQGFFWISTNNGLFQVAKQNLINFASTKTKVVYYHYYDKSNGFATNEFNGGCEPCGLLLNDNSISFPSMQGYVFFNSKEIKPLLPNGKIYFEEAEVDNIMYPKKGDTLNLDPNFKRLRLFVRSPYYGNSKNSNIEIKVDGPISQEWSPLLDDNIIFTSLPPGNYVITARKLTGFDCKYTYSTKVLVVPEKFWQTTIFKILVCSIAIGIGYSMLRGRVNYLKKRNLLLERKVEERSSELYKTITKLKKTKTRLKTEVINHKKLIATITHDIKSPLRFIALTGKNVYETISLDTLDDATKLAMQEESKAVYTSSFQLYNFVENLLEYAKISSQEASSEFYELHTLVQKKIVMFNNIAESKKIGIKNNIDTDLLIYTNKLLFSIIIHNLLDNAIKSTFAGGITFSATLDSEKIILKINDTGRGMTEEVVSFYTKLFAKKEIYSNNIKIGMGFQMISELLILLEGEIQIDSKHDFGTSISILIPNTKHRPKKQ